MQCINLRAKAMGSQRPVVKAAAQPRVQAPKAQASEDVQQAMVLLWNGVWALQCLPYLENREQANELHYTNMLTPKA